MIVTFDKEYLKELYETGKTNDKKYRFQPDIIWRYQKRIGTVPLSELSQITGVH
jgi:proteic killer suppression protein